jgi:glycerophosphoryl diester phosphodiesterase
MTAAPSPGPEREPRPTVSRRILLAAAAAVAVVATSVVVVMNLPDDSGGGDDGREPTPTKAAATEPPKLGGSGAPTVLAHRGGEEKFAWQTIPAFEHAASIGAQIETDVRWTKDGVPVLVHDPGTTPGMECEGGNKEVVDTNWPELRDSCRSPAAKSDDGKQYPIPTFDQAVSAVAKYSWAQMFAEVKVEQTARQVRQFVTILQSYNMTDRVVVTSFMPEELAKIRAQAEELGIDDLRTMQFVSGQRQPAAALEEQGNWGVAVKYDIISKAYVKALNDAGLQVLTWVVNTPEQWQLADDVGADLVMTATPSAYGKWAEVN